MLVQHHTKYEEIHGEDETVWMTQSEHKKLHNRLRKEGQCNISVAELHKISKAANKRTMTGKATHAAYERAYAKSEAGVRVHSKSTMKYKRKNIKSKAFHDAVDKGISIAHRISLNSKTGTVFVEQWFAHPRREIVFIDIDPVVK